MKETKTELIALAGYLIILAGWVFGFDIQQIILLLSGSEQYVRDLRSLMVESASKETGIIVGGGATAVYTVARTWLKARR